MATAATFSRQNDVGSRAHTYCENLVLVVVLVLESRLSIEAGREEFHGISDNLPIETPGCEPQKFAEDWDTAAMRSWSKVRVKNAANVLEKVMARPRAAHPKATPTIFCSATKHSICRSGNAFLYSWEKVEFFMSPSRAITRSHVLPSLMRALAYAWRTAT